MSLFGDAEHNTGHLLCGPVSPFHLVVTNPHAEFRARAQEASQGDKLRQNMEHTNCRSRCPGASPAGREQPQKERHQVAYRAHIGSDRKHLVQVGVYWHQGNCVLRQLACTIWISGQDCARFGL